MDYFLAGAILVASNSDGEETFWVQMLVFVLLAGGWGVYSAVRARVHKSRCHEQKVSASGSWFVRAVERVRGSAKAGGLDFEVVEPPCGEDLQKTLGAGRDLASGMEMLGVEFLLSVVEDTEWADENDVTMRKLSFNELVRRDELGRVGSESLKVYAVDRDSLYGKNIQCEAMKELARRTGQVLFGAQGRLNKQRGD